MNMQLMINKQRQDALWTLMQGKAIRLAVGPNTRHLRVVEGSLWLTTAGTQEAPADDIWLSPGESMELPAGSEWVVEARGSGRFQLLVLQPRPSPLWTSLLGWLRVCGSTTPRGLRA